MIGPGQRRRTDRKGRFGDRVTVTDDEWPRRGCAVGGPKFAVPPPHHDHTAALNGGSRSSATPVTVSVGGGTATSGTDFATVNDFTITVTGK